jgi:hypothetical protein
MGKDLEARKKIFGPRATQNVVFSCFTLNNVRAARPSPVEWSWAGFFRPKITEFFRPGPKNAHL